jgi:hypothetical protein
MSSPAEIAARVGFEDQGLIHRHVMRGRAMWAGSTELAAQASHAARAARDLIRQSR